jgi:hypothetical protein
VSRLIAFGVVLITVLVSGTAAGLRSGRWGSARAVEAAAALLDRVPLSLGPDWDVQETTLSERQVALAEIERYLARRYVHRRTGTIVSMLLVCGRPGPICVYSPETCYLAAGYVPIASAKRYAAPTGPNCWFQVRDFQKSNVATPTLQRVFSSWGHKCEWTVPIEPRFAFAGQPYLYKLYVVRQMAQKNEPIEEDPAIELINALMPQLQGELFSDT